MNVIAYRLPGEKEKLIFKSGEPLNVNAGEQPCFMVKPFDPLATTWYYSLLRQIDKIPQLCLKNDKLGFTFKEFSYEEYSYYIDCVKQMLDNDTNKKVVISRRKSLPFESDPDRLFDSLCTLYPNAFVFFISTRECGTWLGSTPELLLKNKGGMIETMALAGTRLSGSDEEWDLKNIEEQKIVADYISDVFRSFNISHSIGERMIFQAGPVEHLMTPIKGRLNSDTDIQKFLSMLSPTPALAGFPKEMALKIIEQYEGDRFLYGGFCGPTSPSGDFNLYVILRCACLQQDRAILFSGGGITVRSDSSEEWTETENKMKTIKNIL